MVKCKWCGSGKVRFMHNETEGTGEVKRGIERIRAVSHIFGCEDCGKVTFIPVEKK